MKRINKSYLAVFTYSNTSIESSFQAGCLLSVSTDIAYFAVQLYCIQVWSYILCMWYELSLCGRDFSFFVGSRKYYVQLKVCWWKNIDINTWQLVTIVQNNGFFLKLCHLDSTIGNFSMSFPRVEYLWNCINFNEHIA